MNKTKSEIITKIKWLLVFIIIPSIVAATVMFVEENNKKVTYTATTKILIQGDQNQNATQPDIAKTQEFYQRLTYVVADLVDDSIVLEEVSARSTSPLTVEQARQMISASPNQLSQSVLITATSTDSKTAVDTSVLAAEVVKEKQKELQGYDLIHLVDVPTQTTQVSVSYRMKVLVAFVGTLFLLGILYFVIKF